MSGVSDEYKSWYMEPELEVPKNTEWQEQINHKSVPDVDINTFCLTCPEGLYIYQP